MSATSIASRLKEALLLARADLAANGKVGPELWMRIDAIGDEFMREFGTVSRDRAPYGRPPRPASTARTS